jgi:antirestriction protein
MGETMTDELKVTIKVTEFEGKSETRNMTCPACEGRSEHCTTCDGNGEVGPDFCMLCGTTHAEPLICQVKGPRI